MRSMLRKLSQKLWLWDETTIFLFPSFEASIFFPFRGLRMSDSTFSMCGCQLGCRENNHAQTFSLNDISSNHTCRLYHKCRSNVIFSLVTYSFRWMGRHIHWAIIHQNGGMGPSVFSMSHSQNLMNDNFSKTRICWFLCMPRVELLQITLQS